VSLSSYYGSYKKAADATTTKEHPNKNATLME